MAQYYIGKTYSEDETKEYTTLYRIDALSDLIQAGDDTALKFKNNYTYKIQEVTICAGDDPDDSQVESNWDFINDFENYPEIEYANECTEGVGGIIWDDVQMYISNMSRDYEVIEKEYEEKRRALFNQEFNYVRQKLEKILPKEKTEENEE